MKQLYDENGNVVFFAEADGAAALEGGHYTVEDPLDGMRPKDRAEKVRRAHLRRRKHAQAMRRGALAAGDAEGAAKAEAKIAAEQERLRALSAGEWDGNGMWPRRGKAV